MPDKLKEAIEIGTEVAKTGSVGGIGGIMTWLFMRKGLLSEKSHNLICGKVQAEFKLHISEELKKHGDELSKKIEDSQEKVIGIIDKLITEVKK
jgi:hypothetical protein